MLVGLGRTTAAKSGTIVSIVFRRHTRGANRANSANLNASTSASTPVRCYELVSCPAPPRFSGEGSGHETSYERDSVVSGSETDIF